MTDRNPTLRAIKTAFWASLSNANAGMRWLDHDSMDEMIEAAWAGFEEPAQACASIATIRDAAAALRSIATKDTRGVGDAE